MPTITEGRLVFTFPDSWFALKYDAEEGFYKQQLDRHFLNIKAVDIVAIDPQNQRLVLLEVKDFRGYEVENRKRITTGELAEEVGQKALHTISGLYLGLRLKHPDLLPLVDSLLPLPDEIEVVLLLAEDAFDSGSTIKQQSRETNRQNLVMKLKSMFKPLVIKSQVYSQGNVPARASWTVI